MHFTMSEAVVVDKPYRIGRRLLLVPLLIAICLYFVLFARRSVKLSDEQEVYTDRITKGRAWFVIEDEDYRIRFSQEFKVRLPENDFGKHNLLVSDGRRILKLRYRPISKYQWHYHFFMGEEKFEDRLYPHSMFVYRIKRIYLQRAVD
jgi:hypothetical protein